METDMDHVHVLLSYPPTLCVSGMVKHLKQMSTHLMWQKHSALLRRYYWYQKTLWNKGYFYCSIGEVSDETIRRYIQNQG